MLCRILRKEKVNGTRLEPGHMQEVPDSDVPCLISAGIVEPVSAPMLTNAGIASALPAGVILRKRPMEEH